VRYVPTQQTIQNVYKTYHINKLTIYQSSKVRHVMDFSIEQMLVLYHHPMMPICVPNMDKE